MGRRSKATEVFKDMIDDFNIVAFYEMSRWGMKIVLTILMPFILFFWFIWFLLNGVMWLMEIGLKDE
jgi:hypothetical protein